MTKLKRFKAVLSRCARDRYCVVDLDSPAWPCETYRDDLSFKEAQEVAGRLNGQQEGTESVVEGKETRSTVGPEEDVL